MWPRRIALSLLVLAAGCGAPPMIPAADQPPLRLALGAEALPVIRAKLNSELDEYKRWESVTVATAFENPAEGVLDLEEILK